MEPTKHLWHCLPSIQSMALFPNPAIVSALSSHFHHLLSTLVTFKYPGSLGSTPIRMEVNERYCHTFRGGPGQGQQPQKGEQP